MRVYTGMHRRTAVALSLALLGCPSALLAQPAVDTGPQTATELFNKMATLSGLEATFVETKKVALLKVPLRSEGKLFYMRPGYLLRQVTTPKPTQVLITPERLELKDAQGTRTMDLRARPDVKLFVESFIKVLAGDQASLAKAFDIQFERSTTAPQPANSPATWTLTLTPKAAPLSQLVRKLSLMGKGYAVERIEVLETKGDSAVTELTVKAVGRSFTDQEKRTLFGIGQPPTVQ
jgi:outer membrane lipoprotein-sorting protein